MVTVDPSTSLTRWPRQRQPSGRCSARSRPVARARRVNRARGSRCRALQYGSVLAEQARAPWLTSQASTRATAWRHDPSGHRHCDRKAHRVRAGVYTQARPVAPTSARARSTRSGRSNGANGKAVSAPNCRHNSSSCWDDDVRIRLATADLRVGCESEHPTESRHGGFCSRPIRSATYGLRKCHSLPTPSSSPGAGGGEMALVEFVASGEGRRDVAERLAGRGATTTSRLSYSTYRIGRLSDVLSEVSTPCLVATGRFRQS